MAEGTPLHGDRSAWNTDDFASEHAKDISDSTLQRHLPLPGADKGMLESDGTDWQRINGPDYDVISGNDDDTGVTGAELEELSDGSQTALHTHAAGGGSMTTIKEGGAQEGGADIVTLDFDGDDFDLTEDPDTEINISIDASTVIKHSLATAGNDFLVAQESGIFLKRTLDQTSLILKEVLDTYYVDLGGGPIAGDLTFDGAYHPIIDPGSDTDAVLVEVVVDGTPQVMWDQSEDAFAVNKSLIIGTIAGGTDDGTIRILADDRYPIIAFYSADTKKLQIVSDVNLGRMFIDAPDFVRFREGIDGDTLLHLDCANFRIGIGKGTPDTLVDIEQTNASAGVAAVTIKQDDLDEPFIKFIGSASVGDVTRNIVSDVDVGDAIRAGWVKLEVRDDGNQITDQDYFIPIYTLTAPL